jgi:uncharacterized tellurite resistance protein B-like protein
MPDIDKAHWFEGVGTVVSDPLRFKARLGIGDDVYTSSRVRKRLGDLWEATGAGGAAVAIAGSGPVASTFFAPAGVMGFLGIGAAATPVGWLIAAGVVAGGSWIGVKRYLQKSVGERAVTIPDFINTPIDLLAVSLFDLMAPLALKVASVDGDIDESEKAAIESYFTKQWGFDATFVSEGITFAESRLSEFSLEDQARALAEFKKRNRDCNYRRMCRQLLKFVREIVEADGRIDDREEMAIEKVRRVFEKAGTFQFATR